MATPTPTLLKSRIERVLQRSCDLDGAPELRELTTDDNCVTAKVALRFLVGVDVPGAGRLHVPVPWEAVLTFDAEGRRLLSPAPHPPADAVDDARALARGLLARGEVRGVPSTVPRRPQPTYEIVRDPRGRSTLRRIGVTRGPGLRRGPVQ